LGMPRDLDGDTLVDAANHATNYRILPVHLRVEWKGVAGDASFDLYTQFIDQ